MTPPPASTLPRPPRALPDVARAAPLLGGRLDRVGMGGVEVAVRLQDPDGAERLAAARAAVSVDLIDPTARGIHMSRLFLRLQDALSRAPLSPASLAHALEDLLESHAGLSAEAHLSLELEWLVERPALVSDHRGWRAYPVRFEASLTPAGATVRVGATVAYSSTCPCSAALARQLIQDAFAARFAGRDALDPEEVRAWLGRPEAICATPHSQRSEAEVLVQVRDPADAPHVLDVIDRVEACLGTAVQAAVKRADEQAFAQANGTNLLFCEDAARRIRGALEEEPRIVDYRVRCTHRESLHPHDAVSEVTKGVPGGLRPQG
ncbi:MAG: GTP cyclohydrolase FolE2 [Planctomycetota bacterium]